MDTFTYKNHYIKQHTSGKVIVLINGINYLAKSVRSAKILVTKSINGELK